MLTLSGIDEVKARVGEELGVSDWHEVTQDDVDPFAEVTGDDYWIHIDAEQREARARSAGRSPTATTRSRWRRCSPTGCSRSAASPSA